MELSTPQQPTRLTDNQLKISYWYVTNKLVIRRWLIYFLILISALLWFYVGWQLVFYAINYEVEDYHIKRLIFEDNYNLSSLNALKPQQLNIFDAAVLSSQEGRFDFIYRITNPNNGWLATFSYEFTNSEGQSHVQKGFILPGSEKYLMSLSNEANDIGLRVFDINWQRFINYEQIYNNRFRFSITDEEFIAGEEPGDPNRLVFSLKNESAFNYWEVGISVFLNNGGNVVSANYITLDQLRSGESREVELFWNNQLPRITGFEIVPDVNILDQDNIMSPDSPILDIY